MIELVISYSRPSGWEIDKVIHQKKGDRVDSYFTLYGDIYICISDNISKVKIDYIILYVYMPL